MKRFLIVLSSVLTLLMLTALRDLWLKPLMASRLCWEYSGMLSGVVVALILLAVIVSVRTFRSEFKIRFRGTWLLLIPAAFLAQNCAFMTNPLGLSFGLPALSLILFGFTTGIIEEVCLRGFAFAKGGERTPRYTVLLSSLFFGLSHLANLKAGEPLGIVIATVFLAISTGIIFGLIRVITGSIFWCVILHGAIDATYFFSNPESEIYQNLAFGVVMMTAVVSFVCVFVHPKMRPNQLLSPSE